jgi:hypothetical protein
MPPPTSNRQPNIFFLRSSVGQDSMLFRMATSRGRRKSPSSDDGW